MENGLKQGEIESKESRQNAAVITNEEENDEGWTTGSGGCLLLAHVSHSKMNNLKTAVRKGGFIFIPNRSTGKQGIPASRSSPAPTAWNMTVN